MGAFLAVRYAFGIGACATFLGLYFSISLIWIGLALFLLSGLALGLATRNFTWLYRDPFFPPVFLLILSLSASVVAAPPYPFKGAIVKILMPFYLFLFAWAFRLYPVGKKLLFKSCIFLSFFGGLVAVTQSFGVFQKYLPRLNPYLYPLPQSPGLHLAVGLTRHHTTFGFTLILLFHILLSHTLFSKKSRKETVLLLACTSCLVGVLFTFSRGAWLSLAASTGLVFLVVNQRAFLKSCLIGVAFFSALSFFVPSFKQRLASFNFSANQERLELWKVSWKMFEDAPVLGQGYDSFGFRIPQFSDLPKTSPGTPLDPHNMYLEFLATSGLVGLLSFLFFAAFVFKFLSGKLKTSPWALSAFAVFTAFCIGGFFDRYFDMQHTLIPVLCLLGLVSSET